MTSKDTLSPEEATRNRSANTQKITICRFKRQVTAIQSHRNHNSSCILQEVDKIIQSLKTKAILTQESISDCRKEIKEHDRILKYFPQLEQNPKEGNELLLIEYHEKGIVNLKKQIEYYEKSTTNIAQEISAYHARRKEDIDNSNLV